MITTNLTLAGDALISSNVLQSPIPLISLTSFKVGDVAAVLFSGIETDPYGILNFIGDASAIMFVPTQSINTVTIYLTFNGTAVPYTIGNIILYTSNGLPFATVNMAQPHTVGTNKFTLPITIIAANISKCFDQFQSIETRNALNTSFRDNPVWEVLGDAMNNVFQANVVEPRNRLLNVRNPDYFDRPIANSKANLLGIRFFSDTIDDASIERITRYISLYYPRKGTVDFINLLSFLKNTQFTVTQLWTKDFISFVPIPLGPTLTNGGPYYPSSHMAISYNSTDYPLVDGSSAIAELQIAALYYKLAPITHVVHSITSISTPDTALVYLISAAFETNISFSSNF